ncbi:PQQ-binding-like beta-propeller repeat protein [Aestuariicoccus sp. MJ-SS9]|uniref:outer membrane protein assembly factor BamB family protein n=1 Tax=Aestuariicoccus sp. MJ-SS9 TaxID=3079855 RepID=UPI0029139DB2|nr:PQQ-binding-like beta-propeller repeat protein [Aestuariicoccus sp. MJ-SS9]MDU8911117.1 PQQ-binding-like beta-propeller repeat protein [Aestuariicoccus sp. MJ-SS9]
MQRKLTLAALAAIPLLAACGEREEILPGERLGIREVLQSAEPAEDTAGNRALPIALGAATANADWAQSAVSPAFRTTHAALSLPLAPLWSVPIGEGDSRRQRLNTDPVVAGGRVFTMDSAHLVTAVSTSGETLWTFDLTPLRDDPSQAQGGGLAAANGRLYVASGFGTLTALDAATGAEIWTQRLGATATGAPTVRGGVVYVVGGDTTAWAIEADDGRIRWQLDGNADLNNMAGAPAPAVNDALALFSFGNSTVQAAFLQGGLRRWNADIAGGRNGFAIASVNDITGDPVIDGNRAYVGNHSGRLVALDVNSGDRIWTLREGALDAVWPVGGSLFFVSDRHELVRVDAGDGTKIWSVGLPGYEPTRRPQARRDSAYAQHGPILAGGRLLVAGSDGMIRAFNPEDGSLTGTTEVPGGATTRPVVANGTLYVVSTRGMLHAFR